MGIPNQSRVELAVSSIGIESYPQNVIAKNTLWTLQLGYGRFILKEYNGYFCVIENVIVKRFLLTRALRSNLTFDSDKFWVWILDYNNNLSLQEWEPFIDKVPTQTVIRTNIASNVRNVSIYLKENDLIRVLILNESLQLKMFLYSDIRGSSSPNVTDLLWSISRLNEFSNFVDANNTNLDIAYLDTLSPPNIYLETYYLDTPVNFSISQVGNTNNVFLGWNTVTDADFYIIERDTVPTFNNTPISFTSYTNSYTDVIATVGDYYYRVKAVSQLLYLQSLWSDVKSISLVLNADFEADITVGSVDQPITFTDLSTPTGAISLWRWDFGDGTPYFYGQNAVHSYSAPGIYTVSLYIQSGSSSDTETKINYITIVTTLAADFEAIPTVGNANLTVQFFDRSEGTPIYWEWDFGDGSVSYERNPEHTYTKAGKYTVKLKIRDSTFTSTKTKIDYITVNMVADFSASITTGPADLVVFFRDLTVGQPTMWLWDFGDGYTSTEQNPVHTYVEAGQYTVSLTASNENSSDTEIKSLLITVYAVADFYGEPTVGYSSLTVQFVDTSTGTPIAWYWDFGDGEYSYEQNPMHFYKSPGEYTVSLTITTSFNNSIKVKSKYIKISGIATLDIAPEPDKKAYLKGSAVCYDLDKGVEIKFNK